MNQNDVEDGFDVEEGLDCSKYQETTRWCQDHSDIVSFDEEKARNLPAEEIRRRWPRVKCPRCGNVCYASYKHYIYGDW